MALNTLSPQRAVTLSSRKRIYWLIAFTIGLAAVFIRPLLALAHFSWHSALYSHIFLIPVISLYLVWVKRENLTARFTSSRGWALAWAGLGLTVAGWYWTKVHGGWKPQAEDYFSMMTASFLLIFLGGCFAFLGSEIMRRMAFPAIFLVFMIPLPVIWRAGVETFFQNASADAAFWMFKFSGMPVFRNGLQFRLPGFPMEVAPECSGIHSSLVLFITSLLAGHFFFRKWWAKTLLVAAVIVIGILRNGFRIFTIGQLCVRVSHDMVDSVIHRRGGPVFFLLSLIPLFLLLWYLRKLERRTNRSNSKPR